MQPAYNGIKNVLESVYKEGGVRGLYRGIGILCASFSVLVCIESLYITIYRYTCCFNV